MRPSPRVLLITAAVAAVLLAVWMGTRTHGPKVPAPTEPSTTPSRQEATDNGAVEPNRTGRTSPLVPVQPGSTNRRQTTISTPGTNTIADWEDKLDDILGGEGEDAQKAKQMLDLFPRTPEDGQVELAQHLSNLVADENYAPLGKLLADATLPEAVLDVLLADILNRPNGLKLPQLLEIARNTQHPKAEEARDLLELYLEEDYGSDWSKWQAKMEQWIKDNPD